MTAEIEYIQKAIAECIRTDLLYDRKIDFLSPTESLVASGTLKSVDILQLVTFCEENFGVTIPDEEELPDNFENVLSIAELVQRLLELKSTGA
jgi:acyl carrier protein